MLDSPDLFTCNADLVDERLVRRFVTDAIASRLQAESLVVEFKTRRHGSNVVDAVAAMANSDGGLVFVGVDEAASDPIVGIDASAIDALAIHLRGLVPAAMPEIIPVALSGSENRAVVVLRIDEEDVDHPVVVDGRVMVRAPGHTVGARRDEVIALVTRTAGRAALSGSGLPLDVVSTIMWEGEDDDPSVPVEVRLHARWTLPRHAGRRSWLGSAALESAVEALESSPVPALLCADYLRSHEVAPPGWQLTETASVRARLRSAANPSGYRGRSSHEASALITFGGRSLDVLLAIRVRHDDDDLATAETSIADLRDLLLAAAVSAVRTGQAVADAIGARYPLFPPRIEAAITGSAGVNAVSLNRRWQRLARRSEFGDFRFAGLLPEGADVVSLDQVVMNWLVSLIFELGARGFEDDLVALELPKWVRQIDIG